MALKSTIMARLLATENLRVQHANVETASFDLEQRMLTLPTFSERMPSDVEELLIAHEVGHARETPVDGWMAALEPDVLQKLKNKGAGFKTFLNVVEDARIERLIKETYPGLKKTFWSGYRHLYDSGFFGIESRRLSQLLLIDRINLHFKVGAFYMSRFTAEEEEFVKRVEAAQTWEDVVKISLELYDYCIDEMREKAQDELEQGQQDPDAPAISAESNEDPDKDDPDVEKKSVKAGSKTKENAAEEKYFDPIAVTDENFGQNIKKLHDGKVLPKTYTTIPVLNTADYIVPYKRVAKHLELTLNGATKLSTNEFEKMMSENFYKAFLEKNSAYIAYLVKEFELRKNAGQLARARTSKTGALDVSKLYSYKFNNELFKTVTVVPNGKNHGLLMIIDWSGSMTKHLEATVEQLLILTTFCKKVNIPFRAYAFLSYRLDTPASNKKHQVSLDEDQELRTAAIKSKTPVVTIFKSDIQLAELLSDKMSRSEYMRAITALMRVGANAWRTGTYGDWKIGMKLSGTPLAEAVVLSRHIVDEFKKAYKLDTVNVTFLTDGEGTLLDTNGRTNYVSENTVYIDELTKEESEYKHFQAHYDRFQKKKDPEEKFKSVSREQLKALVQLSAKVTGAKYIGFYLVNKFPDCLRLFPNKSSYEYGGSIFRAEGYVTLHNLGFDEYYVIKTAVITSEKLEVEEGATTNKLLNAFKKNQAKKSFNRILLNRFIKAIA